MELLWKSGELVVYNHNNNIQNEPRIDVRPDSQLFIQEDELASWLHYPTADEATIVVDPYDLCTIDNTQVYPAQMPPPSCHVLAPTRDSTEIGSNETTAVSAAVALGYTTSTLDSGTNGSAKLPPKPYDLCTTTTQVYPAQRPPPSYNVLASTRDSTEIRSNETLAVSAAAALRYTASALDSGTSGSTELPPKPPPDRKRKEKETDDVELQSEDVELESPDAKLEIHGSPSKRSRALEVHNLSERRRRSRINEKMKALQKLIPHCNKTDKSSMLDDAIEYLKSLQLQVQMLSMGYGMVPVMYPGVLRYMAPLPMGTSLGRESTYRPIMPYPSAASSSALRASVVSSGLGSLLPRPGFHMQLVSFSDPSGAQAPTQSDPNQNLHFSQIPSQQQMPNFPTLYPHYIHAQVLPSQNQAAMQQNSSRPSSNSEDRNNEIFYSG